MVIERLLVLLIVVLAYPILGKANTVSKFSQTQEKSFSLEGIIDPKSSKGFACMFGRFKVENLKTVGNMKHFNMRDSGLLINSGWLHKETSANPDIINVVTSSSKLENGEILSVHCSGRKIADKTFEIDYYVIN